MGKIISYTKCKSGQNRQRNFAEICRNQNRGYLNDPLAFPWHDTYGRTWLFCHFLRI